EISISPNPTQGAINISMPQVMKGSAEVYDVTGKLVLREIVNGKARLDISDKEQGIYMVMLKDDTGKVVKTEKLVKN
ncbi:MAG: T9SS type A sorting domain-containing protein, partial [Bacteroidia bacterium]